jgi:hypothetical protein
MHDSLLVHVGEGTGYLVDVLDDHALLKVDFVLYGLLDDQLEVTLLCPLDCDEQFV